MAVSFVNEAHASNSSTAAHTLVCNAPASIANGDVLLAFTGSSIGLGFAPPAGWTQIGSTATAGTDVDCKAWFKVAASEPASYTFSLSGSNTDNPVIQILAFRGVDNAAPININGASTTNTTQNVTGPTVTSTATGLAIYHRTVRDNVNLTATLVSGSSKNTAGTCEMHISAPVNVIVGCFYNTADTAAGSTVGSAINYNQTTPVGQISRTIVLKTGTSVTNAPAAAATATAASNDATTTEVFGVGEPSSAAAGLDATVQVGLAPTAGVATSTASGLDATVTGTSNAFPDAPSATSAALDASVSTAVSVSADVATATVLANDATCTQGVSPVAETPTVTATSNDATVLVTASPTADVAPATAIGLDATVTTTAAPTAQVAPATAMANDATVSTSGSTNAPADVALVTAAGLDAAVTTSVAVLPDAPVATGLAYDATTLQAVSPSAECPTSPAVAYDATVTMSSNTSANADLTTATGLAYDATVATQVVGHAFAGVATATAAAYDAVASHPVRVNADVATSSVTALGALAHGGVIIAKLEYTWQVPFEVRDLPVGSEVRTYTLEGDWDKVPQSV